MHLGEGVFALVKVVGVEGVVLQGCEPVRCYHMSCTSLMGLHVQVVIVNQHRGVELLITTSKRKNKNSQGETAREVGILTS